MQIVDWSVQEAEVDFELADQIFARATIKDPESVCLWLGANVMVEYSLEEVGAPSECLGLGR